MTFISSLVDVTYRVRHTQLTRLITNVSAVMQETSGTIMMSHDVQSSSDGIKLTYVYMSVAGSTTEYKT